ncbi:MAG: DUF6428 family protein [Chthoniobacter sp.]|uniref:DUF6428 family protein n=1 Tax=Chthoniobacter sp. TaxID=2510640 RepID=UPI0032AA597E
MKTSEFKTLLEQHPDHELRFVLPDGGFVPAHGHITEVGRVDKTFIDCGGTMRRVSTCSLQAWVAEDLDHRLSPGKLAGVLGQASPIFGADDLEVEIEYEDCTVSQFPALGVSEQNGILAFHLGWKHTDCLAKDVCLPQAAGCAPGSGCC